MPQYLHDSVTFLKPADKTQPPVCKWYKDTNQRKPCDAVWPSKFRARLAHFDTIPQFLDSIKAAIKDGYTLRVQGIVKTLDRETTRKSDDFSYMLSRVMTIDLDGYEEEDPAERKQGLKERIKHALRDMGLPQDIEFGVIVSASTASLTQDKLHAHVLIRLPVPVNMEYMAKLATALKAKLSCIDTQVYNKGRVMYMHTGGKDPLKGQRIYHFPGRDLLEADLPETVEDTDRKLRAVATRPPGSIPPERFPFIWFCSLAYGGWQDKQGDWHDFDLNSWKLWSQAGMALYRAFSSNESDLEFGLDIWTEVCRIKCGGLFDPDEIQHYWYQIFPRMEIRHTMGTYFNKQSNQPMEPDWVFLNAVNKAVEKLAPKYKANNQDPECQTFFDMLKRDKAHGYMRLISKFARYDSMDLGQGVDWLENYDGMYLKPCSAKVACNRMEKELKFVNAKAIRAAIKSGDKLNSVLWLPKDFRDLINNVGIVGLKKFSSRKMEFKKAVRNLPPFIEMNDNMPINMFNRGRYSWDEIKNGDPNHPGVIEIRNFLLRVFCSDYQGAMDFLMQWAAHVMYNTDGGTQVIPVARSDSRGLGKTLVFGTFIPNLMTDPQNDDFSLAYTISNLGDVDTRFTAAMTGSRYIHIDEGASPEEMNKVFERLKSLSTGKKTRYEGKGKDPKRTGNYMCFALTGNADSLIKIEMLERRPKILPVREHYKMMPSEYHKLNKLMHDDLVLTGFLNMLLNLYDEKVSLGHMEYGEGYIRSQLAVDTLPPPVKALFFFADTGTYAPAYRYNKESIEVYVKDRLPPATYKAIKLKPQESLSQYEDRHKVGFDDRIGLPRKTLIQIMASNQEVNDTWSRLMGFSKKKANQNTTVEIDGRTLNPRVWWTTRRKILDAIKTLYKDVMRTEEIHKMRADELRKQALEDLI